VFFLIDSKYFENDEAKTCAFVAAGWVHQTVYDAQLQQHVYVNTKETSLPILVIVSAYLFICLFVHYYRIGHKKINLSEYANYASLTFFFFFGKGEREGIIDEYKELQKDTTESNTMEYKDEESSLSASQIDVNYWRQKSLEDMEEGHHERNEPEEEKESSATSRPKKTSSKNSLVLGNDPILLEKRISIIVQFSIYVYISPLSKKKKSCLTHFATYVTDGDKTLFSSTAKIYKLEFGVAGDVHIESISTLSSFFFFFFFFV
ncbi:hypothetical protein RFI_14023, partial [Reticulomyxa filosa]